MENINLSFVQRIKKIVCTKLSNKASKLKAYRRKMVSKVISSLSAGEGIWW